MTSLQDLVATLQIHANAETALDLCTQVVAERAKATYGFHVPAVELVVYTRVAPSITDGVDSNSALDVTSANIAGMRTFVHATLRPAQATLPLAHHLRLGKRVANERAFVAAVQDGLAQAIAAAQRALLPEILGCCENTADVVFRASSGDRLDDCLFLPKSF